MKIEIEEYKGQTIFYEEDYDKFTCDITIEDKFKNTKRQSLVEVRKEIDAFIKLNAEFKPCKILVLDKYDKSSFVEKEMTGIRTDGKIIIKDGNYKSQYGKKELENVMVYNHDIVEAKEKLEEEFENARKKYTAEVKKLCSKLTKMDFSKYEHILNAE